MAGKASVFTTGEWHLPKADHIGYLDQHYSTLSPDLSAIEHIQALCPGWTEIEARRHLSDFLFRTNKEVMQITAHLSGGEKARLSLSMIAAKTPRLLILDEITNNLDLETKTHVIQVLKAYPGAMIISSHDNDFLASLAIAQQYTLADGKIS
jgi:ATPase subunit of ABC transporter with duplicated ATPase domains